MCKSSQLRRLPTSGVARHFREIHTVRSSQNTLSRDQQLNVMEKNDLIDFVHTREKKLPPHFGGNFSAAGNHRRAEIHVFIKVCAVLETV